MMHVGISFEMWHSVKHKMGLILPRGDAKIFFASEDTGEDQVWGFFITLHERRE